MDAEPVGFQVVYSEQVRNQVRLLLDEAVKTGNLSEIEKSLLAIDKRLEEDPVEFGEPIKNLGIVKWQVRIGFARPLLVEFRGGRVTTDRIRPSDSEYGLTLGKV